MWIFIAVKIPNLAVFLTITTEDILIHRITLISNCHHICYK